MADSDRPVDHGGHVTAHAGPAGPHDGPEAGEYEQLIQQLAETVSWMHAQRAEADSWYTQQCGSAERAVRSAAEAVRRAEAEVEAAREEVERTEAEVAHLWQTLRDRFGFAARRVSDPPVPTQGAAAADPVALIDGARELLERAKRPGDLPSSAQPLLALFGMLGAAAAYGMGLLARAAGARYGGDLAVVMPVLALVVTLLGPVIGLAPARLLADRRHAGLDTRAVATVLVAGVITTAALFAVAR